MSCGVDYNFRRQYQETVLIRFISSTETAVAQTSGHIPNSSDGYIVAGGELEALGQANAAIGSDQLVAAPYPTRMRPIGQLNKIYQANNVWLDKVEFSVYDTTLTGSAVQDAATVTAIHNSRTGNDAFGQSLYRNGMPVNWIPNFFNPELWIDKENIFQYFKADNFGTRNQGDESIGIPLPACIDVSKKLGKVKNVSMNGQVAQYIHTTGLYQRYCLLACCWFWVGKGTAE